MPGAGEPLWSLGLFGESLFNIHVHGDGSFLCVDHAVGDELGVSTVADIEQWLVDRRAEEDLRQSDVALTLARSHDWGVLKLKVFTIAVSWSDGAFTATLTSNFEPVISPELADAVKGAAEMACRLFGAPVELALAGASWIS